MPFGWDLLPGINVGNAIHQLTTGEDRDIIEGYSDNRTNENFNLQSDYDKMLQSAGNEMIREGQQKLSGGGGNVMGSGVYGGGGGGVSAAQAKQNAEDLAYLDDQEGLLRNMLGSAQATLKNGLTQIGDSFNKESSRTNESKARAQAGYATNREDTTRAKQANINQINSGARTLSDSVRRMLGMASGTNSTAFREAAPNMIARDTSMKRSGAIETAGKNFRDIDTAEGNTLNAFKQYMEDLEEQRKSKESGLREGVLQQEQQINTNLGQIARDREAIKGGGYDAARRASAPYQAAVTDRQRAIDGLFEKYRTPYATRDVAVETPELGQYTVDRTALQGGGGTATGVESPYQTFLKKKFQEVA